MSGETGVFKMYVSSSDITPVVVQLVKTSGQACPSGVETVITFSVPSTGTSPPGYDTNSLFDGMSLVTITADTAGYWETDIIGEMFADAPAVEFELRIEINGNLLDDAYFQKDSAADALTMNLTVPVEGVNLVEGDVLRIVAFVVTDGSDATLGDTVWHLRRISAAIPEPA